VDEDDDELSADLAALQLSSQSSGEHGTSASATKNNNGQVSSGSANTPSPGSGAPTKMMMKKQANATALSVKQLKQEALALSKVRRRCRQDHHTYKT
jgi:hypothetical protein